MSLERPVSGWRPRRHNLSTLRTSRQLRRLVVALLTGAGVAFGTYGVIAAITSNDAESSPERAEHPNDTSPLSAITPAVALLDEGQRAIALAYDHRLPLDVGDEVEVVAVLPGPIDNVAEVVATARVLSLTDESAVVVVDDETALKLVETQANGIVRLLRLP